MSRTVKDALKIAQRKIRPIRFHETIARRGYAEGGDISTGEPMSVPEKPETIGMQLRQLANGKRAGVFVAKGTPGVSLPEKMRVFRTQEGNIIFNPEAISREEIEDAVTSGRLNELLGYVQSKPEALEESLEQGDAPRVVVSRDQNGIEQDAAAVSPDRVEEQANIFEDRAQGGSTISVEDLSSSVVRDRLAEGGVPDEESQEKFLKEYLAGSAPQYEPEAGIETALDWAALLPGAGAIKAAGFYPTGRGGYRPGIVEDLERGRTFAAVRDALGLTLPLYTGVNRGLRFFDIKQKPSKK